MLTVTITRQPSTSSGTFGSLSIEGSDFTAISLELPWDNNLPDQSCIPTGSYTCLWQWSPEHNRNNYHIQNVMGRSNCEIHSANIISQLLGCICLGAEVVQFPPNTFPGVDITTEGVEESQITVASFEAILNQQPFTLVIQ